MGAESIGPLLAGRLLQRIGQIIEHIESSGGFRSLLLVAKDQIDPLVELAGHKLALQRLQKDQKYSETEG
ncbi:hypothetical protein EYF80_000168 [Liparis tanakae]|uniref:Uncharacterized protein n=1 Tax=Liparis tanakae TaxID=230148 RepID=A0A4Z2JH28_9TELE|nr:hypothetical protein EYF80_000168 [Liparis tanakae]